jgi:hypothetical protein
MLAIDTSNKRDPLTRPVERLCIVDRSEAEVPFCEPLSKKRTGSSTSSCGPGIGPPIISLRQSRSSPASVETLTGRA